MNHYLDGPGNPRPEELAGYVDGELPEAARHRVEEWLATHPDAAADIEAQQHLARLWSSALPPAPAEDQWAEVLSSINAALTGGAASAPLVPSGGQQRRGKRRWLAAVGLVLATAAALLVAVGLMPAPAEPFPVASADDVEIISVDDADIAALVVGKPPLSEPLVLAEAGDVVVERIEPDVDGMVPDIYGEPTGRAAPMIIAPLDWGVAKAPAPAP